LKLAAQYRGQTIALLDPRVSKPIESQRPTIEDGAATLFDYRLRVFLDRLDNSAQRQQAIDARRRCFDFAGELVHQGDELGEGFAVHPHGGRCGPRNGKARGKTAAAEAAPENGAELRLQHVKTGRQAEPEIE